MNFFDNLFGTIAAGSGAGRVAFNQDFIPVGKNGETLTIRGESASWIGLQSPMMQLWAYDFCFPLASVVDRLAEADITGIIEILRATGKGKENFATNDWAVQMKRLMANPNPLQTWEQFRGQQTAFKKIFGYCPVVPIQRSGFGPEYSSTMWNIPPWLFTAVPTGDLLYQTDLSGIVKEYRVSLGGHSYTLRPEDVMILEDSFMIDHRRSYILPQSRLIGLDMAVSNLCAAMEADNVLLRKRGPLGFISLSPKGDATSPLPLDPNAKEELQEDLQKYGTNFSQFQYVISKNAATWNPMSFDVKELGTKETVIAAAKAVCHRFGFPWVLFEDSDSTYSNQESAHKKFYDNNVIPNSNRDLAKYSQFFKAAENNCKICSNYSHLSVFQEDSLNEGRARAYLDQGLQIEYQNDIITLNQWLEALEMETVPTGDVYYSQSPAKLAADAAKQAQVDAQAKLNSLNQQQPTK